MDDTTKQIKEISKESFTAKKHYPGGPWDIEMVKLSLMFRQTEALEAMSVNQINLQRAHDYYKKRTTELLKELEFMKRSAASYKGKLHHEKQQKNHENPK